MVVVVGGWGRGRGRVCEGILRNGSEGKVAWMVASGACESFVLEVTGADDTSDSFLICIYMYIALDCARKK